MPVNEATIVLSSLVSTSVADLAAVSWCPITRRVLGRLIAASRVLRGMEETAATELAERSAMCDLAECDDVPF